MKKCLSIMLFVLPFVCFCLPVCVEANVDAVVDVFQLVRTGTPAQLREAVRRGANFNVKINLYDVIDMPDAPDLLFDYGNTPLHDAAYFNTHKGVISFLVSQGLDVNAEASSGASGSIQMTPLQCALDAKNTGAIKELLLAGANPNIDFGNGSEIDRNTFSILVQAGYDVNSHYEVGEKRIVLSGRVFRDDVAEVDMRNFKASCTPLINAVLADNSDAVNMLLDFNADPNIRSMEGKSALDYARELPNNSRIKRSGTFNRLRTTKIAR